MSDVLTKETVVCNCADVPPTMPTYRTKHLPICPVWAFENAGYIVHQVTETIRGPDTVSEPYKGPLDSNPFIPSWCKDE